VAQPVIPTIRPPIYGIPYIVVPGSQPLVPVTFVDYDDESDVGAPGRPPGYPNPRAGEDPGRLDRRWRAGQRRARR
jgi:hypothetical protein